MHLEPIHLLVIEVDGMDECSGIVLLSRGRAQTGVRGELFVLGEPRTDGAFGYFSMEAPAQLLLRLGEGIAEVEGGECFENGLERVGLILSCVSRGEAVQAFAAFVDLKRLHSVAALAFFDGVLGAALRADGIFYGGPW